MANICKVIFVGRISRPVGKLVRVGNAEEIEFGLVYNPDVYDPHTGVSSDQGPVYLDAVAQNRAGGRQLASVIADMRPNDQHYFEGTLVRRFVIDERTNQKRSRLFLMVTHVAFLTPKY